MFGIVSGSKLIVTRSAYSCALKSNTASGAGLVSDFKKLKHLWFSGGLKLQMVDNPNKRLPPYSFSHSSCVI